MVVRLSLCVRVYVCICVCMWCVGGLGRTAPYTLLVRLSLSCNTSLICRAA